MGGWGQQMEAIIYRMDKKQGPTVEHRELYQYPMIRTSLVAQWLGIRLPMHGTRVRALVWEDPTCCGATKPLHNC